MVFASWRGVVGVVKPTHRPGSLEEFIRLLPEGIGLGPLALGAGGLARVEQGLDFGGRRIGRGFGGGLLRYDGLLGGGPNFGQNAGGGLGTAPFAQH